MVLETLCYFQPSGYKGGIGYAGGGMNGVHTSGICEVPGRSCCLSLPSYIRPAAAVPRCAPALQGWLAH